MSTPRQPERSLNTILARAGGLVVAGNLGTRLAGIASMAVLGRLLTPEDYGIYALAFVFVALCNGLINRQFELALIRKEKVEDSHYETAFTLAVLAGCATGMALFQVSDLLAAALGEPQLTQTLKWLSLIPIIDGLRNPYFVRFEKQLRLTPAVALELGAKLVQIAVAISLAVILRSYWAIVIGLISLSLFHCTITHLASARISRLSFVHWREFLAFGSWLTLTGLAGAAMQRSDTAMIGARLGTAAVGQFNMGHELCYLLTQQLGQAWTRVFYPAFATLAGDKKKLAQSYYTAQEITLAIMMPLGVGLALCAREILYLFVGPQWDAAVPTVQWLAPIFALSVLVFPIQSLLMIKGDTRTIFVRNLIVAGVQVPLIILGLWAFGLVGALAARVLAVSLHVGLSLIIAGRLLQESPMMTIVKAWRVFAACAIMSLVVFWFEYSLSPISAEFLGNLFHLAVKVVVGGVTYTACSLLIWHWVGRPEGLESRVIQWVSRN